MRRWKEKPRPGSLGRITWMLAAGFLALWLGCMGCLTSVVAWNTAQSYLRAYGDQARNISYDLEWFATPEQLYEERRLWDAVDKSLVGSGYSVAGGDEYFLELRAVDSKPFYVNAAYDAEGNYLISSWEDFFYFEYMTEEEWAAKQERSANNISLFKISVCE